MSATAFRFRMEAKAMTASPTELCVLWRAVHGFKGWLSKVPERMGLDAGDEAFLFDLDESWTVEARALEKRWRKESAAMSAELRREVAQEQPEWVRERRREYLSQEIQNLKDKISQAYADYATEAANDGPSVNRLLILECSQVSDLEKRLSRYSIELRGLDKPQGDGGRLSEAQIEHAKARPLESVLPEPPVKGFISCPVHLERVGHPDRHPSMLVKGGFGHCFSCGGNLTALDFLVKVRGLSFRQAVEALQ